MTTTTFGIREIKRTDSRTFEKKNGGFTGVKTFDAWLTNNSDDVISNVYIGEDPVSGLKIPQFGEAWSSSKPGLKVTNTKLSEEDDGYLQKVVVSYSSDDIEEEEDNPVDDAVTFDYDTTVIKKLLYEDPQKGQGVSPSIPANPAANPPRPLIDENPYSPLITNSAGVQTPLTVDDGDRMISQNRNITPVGFDPDDKFELEFTTNDAPVTIDGKFYPTHRCWIKKIKVGRKKTRNDIEYHKENIIFGVERPDYDTTVDLLNQGVKELSVNGILIDIKIKKTGKVASQPIMLDKDGFSQQDPLTATPSYFRHNRYPEADWSSLNLS